MVEQTWSGARMKTIICIDSYHNGVPVGRIYNPTFGVDTFKSLSQFLLKMETMLDESKMPQSSTAKRTFFNIADSLEADPSPSQSRRGELATFELRVIFRQHTSWQGVVTWLEAQMEQSYRSVLELILLMDSALREAGK